MVFQGNEEAYYLTESVIAFAASAMIPIGQAASAGNLTFRSGATIVAKEGIATAAGAGAQKYTTDLTGNQTAVMIAGMAASMATAKGLNGIEAGAKKLVKPKLGDVGAGGEIGTDYSGIEWLNYFRDTYGVQNVCWENCNPCEVAMAWQGAYPYIGIDNYTNLTLHEGDIIWMGEPYPTGYSTTTQTIELFGNDARKIFEGLQVKPYYEKGMSVAEYRAKLTPYRVNCDINVADGIALNNPQFGEGGLAQRFDPNFQYNVANDYITRIDNQSISLDNTQVSLKDYFKMMSQLK